MMIKRLLIFLVLAFFAWQFLLMVTGWEGLSAPGEIASHYLGKGREELGAANIVTAIVVTYRGLDTLGEVSVLFLAAAGIGFLLGAGKLSGKQDDNDRGLENGKARRKASEILETGADIVVPAIAVFGVYIFINGHLSPGGGFQGGAVIASAILLLFLSHPSYSLNHGVLKVTESLSGAAYVGLGLLGIILAGGFLDARFLPAGDFGRILSAGAIPLIYSLIGLKVGTELVGILEQMRRPS
jgi:multicomponent Na+:H+ antiporter subunit B